MEKKRRKKWKRSFAVIIALALIISQIQAPIYAKGQTLETNVGADTVSGNALGNSVSGNDIEEVPESVKKGAVYHNMINDNIPEAQARKLSGVTDEMLENEKK